MKKNLALFLLLLSSYAAHSQLYTFECVSGARLSGDSCDICPNTIVDSRSFNGLVIYRDSQFYRWVDQPYSIRTKPGGIVEYWEHGANPYSERITIPFSLTGFFTVEGMADSTWCNFQAPNRYQRLGLDSLAPTDFALTLVGDPTDVVFREGSNITFEIDGTGDTLVINSTGGGSATIANNGISDNEDGGKIRLGNRYMGSPDAPFTMARKINIDGRLLHIGDLSDSTLFVIDGAMDRVGIRTDAPARDLHVNGEVRISDLITDTPTLIVGADGDGDLGAITLGSGLSITSGTLDISGVFGYNRLRQNGTDKTQRLNANLIPSATIDFTLNDDAGAALETEISASVIDLSITTAKIAADAVTSAKIPDNAIGTTEIAANAVGNADFRQGVARSVVGVTGNATANVADIQGTADQVLRVNTAGTALAFGTVATGGIADDAVTYAKIQNVVADDVLLGRISGAGGNVEELTVANAYTLLGITGTAGRFAVFTGANTLTTDAAFTFDGANDRATFTGTVAGVGANTGILNLNTGALGAATTFLRMSGNVSSNMIAELVNSSNNAAAASIFTLSVGGDAASDPVVQFNVNGAITHAVGIDNSNGNRLKLTPNSATPGGNVNMGVIIRDNGGLGNTGINKDFPNFPLDGLGTAQFELWQGTGNLWTAANVAFGAGAGTGPSITTITGLGNGVRIDFSTGTTPTADGDVLILGFPLVFTTTSINTFSARDADAAVADFYISAENNAGCTLKVKGTLSASTSYSVNIHHWGY